MYASESAVKSTGLDQPSGGSTRPITGPPVPPSRHVPSHRPRRGQELPATSQLPDRSRPPRCATRRLVDGNHLLEREAALVVGRRLLVQEDRALQRGTTLDVSAEFNLPCACGSRPIRSAPRLVRMAGPASGATFEFLLVRQRVPVFAQDQNRPRFSELRQCEVPSGTVTWSRPPLS